MNPPLNINTPRAGSHAPTDAQQRAIAQLTKNLSERIAQLNAIVGGDLPALQKQVRESGIAPPAIPMVKPPGQ